MATRTRAGGRPPADEQADLLSSAPEAPATSELEQPEPEATTDEARDEGATAEDEPDIPDEVLDQLEAAGDLPADEAPIANAPPVPRRQVDPMLEHATPRLLASIAKAMKALKRLKKTEKNDQGNYRYASVDAFFDACQDVLADNDLVLLSDEAQTGVSSYETKNGRVGLLDSTWRFLLCSTTEQDVYIGPFLRRSVAPASMGAQAYGAVLSYAIKNYLRGQFLIPTGDAEVDQTHGGALPPRAREASGGQQQQRRQDPPGYVPTRNQAGPAPRNPAPPPEDDDRIPMRSRQPAGNGGGAPPGPPAESQARATVFRLRGRLNKAGIAVERVLKSYAPAMKLEDLTDEQIRAVHKRLDDTGVEKVPGQES